MNRDFKAPRPNMLWLSDFTYVATWQGFVYVAFVIDAYARRSSAGGCRGPRRRASCSTPWSRLCMTDGPSSAAASSITATVRMFWPAFLGGLTLTAMDRLAWLVPQGVSARSDPHSDRPRSVSFPGPVGRPRRLAARFRLAGACDPRRA